eukprot:508968-Pyramimonas_sp.AAC.1
MELGNAQLLVEKDARAIRDRASLARWVILSAGCPRADLTRLRVDRRGRRGRRSGLFVAILRAQAL